MEDPLLQPLTNGKSNDTEGVSDGSSFQNPPEMDTAGAALYFAGPSASGEQLPKVIYLSKSLHKIGRANESVDIVLDSPLRPRMLSRIHAIICQEENTWKIIDCKSLNGIFVNSIKVSEAVLKDGDTIVFGEGGKQTLGSKLVQSNPELIYTFKILNNSLKRRRSSEKLEEARQAEEKRRKLEAEAEAERLRKEKEEAEALRKAEEEARRKAEEEALARRQAEEEATRQKAELQARAKELEANEQKLREEVTLRERLLEEQRRQIEELIHSWQQSPQRPPSQNEPSQPQGPQPQPQPQSPSQSQSQSQSPSQSQPQNELQLSFHEQIARIKRQYEQQRNVFEQEIKEKEEAIKKEKLTLEERLEQERRKLQEELQRQQNEMESLKKETIDRKALEEEFTCIICQELMVHASTLECSHSFCSECLEEWLNQKKICPMCRKPCNGKAVRALNLDNVIEKIVERMSAEEQQSWKTRAAKRKREEEELRQLNGLISTAKQRGLKFLSIVDSWTPEERKVFADGVRRYSGKARLLYCETTGLTQSYINTCPLPSLRTAVRNMGLNVTNWNDAAGMRQALLNFLQAKEN